MRLPTLTHFKNWDIFALFLSVRLFSIFAVQTYFVADEYYQSVEVAHKLAFGYGHLTWEWSQGIRSYGYPIIFTILYKALQYCGLDNSITVVYGPRVLQAIISAYADLCFYKWSGTKKWAIFTISTAWFWFYMGSRTLINTFETSLTTIALSKFPWLGKEADDRGNFLWIIAPLFVLRPTSVITWIPLCLFHLIISEKSVWRLIFTKYLPVGYLVLAVSIAIDSLVHGSLIITPYNFLKLNVFESIASNYGTHPWHWYLSSGLPAILGIQILPFIMAILIILKARKNHPNELVLLATIVFTIFVLSFLPHKEFRFILPLLPIVLYISSRFLAAWSRKASMLSIWLVTAIIFLGNAIPAWYVGYSHQRGTLDVMEPLSHIAKVDPNNTSFLFLMPCHSTPLYSHLHVNVSTKFLTCNPNLNKIPNYVDEADLFYKNPNAWLRNNYPPNSSLPSHIICFDNLVPLIGSDILTKYKKIKQFFHCNIPVSSRVGRYVVLYEYDEYAQL
ncbi:GPI mannosyltransferase 3 [Sitophilus oryzae]|uniref:Mannosyltransferase n=1 Tax=Sitophilus oryzae TaxID=7048 RepID=A0A6J2YKI8_SITOR|nr:GPI mannosyltransferase 3 [Sitophilus oryzae]